MLEQLINSGQFHPLGIILTIVGYLMPFPLGYLAFFLWKTYRTDRFISGIKWALLEIQVPREVTKTPAAMELVFSNALYHKSMKGFWEIYVQGAPWFWFSLEIASIDGKVHFFVRTPTRVRHLVETQIYAQYPQAKVVEVDDYVNHVPKYTKNGNWNMWGAEWKKDKEDFLPIKTWQDFGDEMSTGQKEEYKVDPLTPMIEYLGSLSKGQQVWIQIIVRQSTKQYHSHKTGKHVNFQEATIEFIHQMLRPYTRIQKNEDIGDLGGDVRTPDFMKPVVKRMTENMNQIHFDCGIRLVALARKDLVPEEKFQEQRREVRLLFRQFAAPASNELERYNSTQFDSPWSDPTGLALAKIKHRMIEFYRDRVFFHPPLQYEFNYPKLLSFFFPSGKPIPFVLSVEELATLFHLPGMVAETPSFKRIESRIAKPPSNLPS